MNANEYQALAMRTSNKTLSTRDHILNGVLGLCGEAGEVADSVKKAYMQGHVIDAEHIAEELGDVCWYIAEAATAIGYTIDEILEKNVAKLKKRYPAGFEAARSIHREV